MAPTVNDKEQIGLQHLQSVPYSYGYVYRVVNEISGKIYIGQHKGSFDSRYFGSGIKIKSAIRKHGIQNFSVKQIGFCASKDELDNLEIKSIEKYRSIFRSDLIYNIANGGGTTAGVFPSEESRKKNSESHLGISVNKGSNNPMYGKRHRPETIEKLKYRAKNRPPVREDVKLRLRSINLGKHLSEETKIKMSISHKRIKSQMDGF